MSVSISYMGTKRHLTGDVYNTIRDLPAGVVLDAFSGMGAVAESLAGVRNVWVNDVQPFAALASQVLFCSTLSRLRTNRRRILRAYTENAAALHEVAGSQLAAEARYLSQGDVEALVESESRLSYCGTDTGLESIRSSLAEAPTTFPYRLASITYPGSFFGVRQCLEIDSLRYAFDRLFRDGDITAEERDWYIVALCQVLTKVNNSTGQFAHFLRPSKRNAHRVLQKRRRSVLEEFFGTIPLIGPVGRSSWRRGNQATQMDVAELLDSDILASRPPAIIYADPPYSKAQYSRYYHVLDVLVAYGYPQVEASGRYPTGRFQTRFALDAQVDGALRDLALKSARTGATLVMSYPTNGLLESRGGSISLLLRDYFSHVRLVKSTAYLHSSFGGAKADARIAVEENLYVASN